MSGTCSHRADSSKRCTSTTLVTTQMLTQMLLATVSLCVLCETAVRSRPCAQLLPQPTTSMRGLSAAHTPAAERKDRKNTTEGEEGRTFCSYATGTELELYPLRCMGRKVN